MFDYVSSMCGAVCIYKREGRKTVELRFSDSRLNTEGCAYSSNQGVEWENECGFLSRSLHKLQGNEDFDEKE